MNQLIDQFEDAWQTGKVPELDDFVAQLEPDSTDLVEFVAIDMEYRWKTAGSLPDPHDASGRSRQLPVRPSLVDYLNVFPELGEPSSVCEELIAEEYRIRHTFGDKPGLDDLVRLYGQRAESVLLPIRSEIGHELDSGSVHLPGQASRDTATLNEADSEFESPPFTRREDPAIGSVFGRYRILRFLGKGAMGAVYLSHDEQLQRDVALKIPQLHLMKDPDLRERFYREARSAASLRHAGICPVYDVGETDGVHYISMAYVRGRSLREEISDGNSPDFSTVAVVIRKLAMALHEAHRHNVIHRDLKPGNILMDERNDPVVLDFGLARWTRKGEEHLTQSGMVIGTPAYMSPEQVDGDVDRIGPATDIYSLGIILYELLTGSIPFKGSLSSILRQIGADEPKPPTQLRPDVPLQLESICLRMIAKACEERYQSMEQVADALTGFLDSQQSGAPVQESADVRREPVSEEIPQPPSLPGPHSDGIGAMSESPGSVTSPQTAAAGSTGSDNAGPDRRRLMIGGGLVGAALLLAGIVFLIDFGKVTVRITVDDPSMTLRIDGDDVVIEGEGSPIRLTAGPHSLVVVRDGLEFEPREFTVKKDGRNAIHVAVVDDDVQILEDGEKPKPVEVSEHNNPRVSPATGDTVKIVDSEDVPDIDDWAKAGEGSVQINSRVAKLNTHRGAVSLICPAAAPAGDYTLTVRTRVVSGPANVGFGLVFGRRDTNEQFLFDLQTGGQYRLTRIHAGKRTELIPWTASTRVKGVYRHQEWTVRVQGTEIVLFGDGHRLGQFDAGVPVAGKFGVHAEATGLTVDFDNVSFDAPGDAPVPDEGRVP